MKDKAIALACADIHLSLNPPVWRTAEPNWLKAQARPLNELRELQRTHGGVPILIAGDIFHKWYGSLAKGGASTLINWAIDSLPDNIYAIPGQHDMPEHDDNQLEDSAFWTLKEAGKIEVLYSDSPFILDHKTVVTGFHYGEPVSPPDCARGYKQIAVVHQYNWIPGAEYKTAATKEADKIVNNKRKEFDGYDIVICGDNHASFRTATNDGMFWNCGCFVRRNANEISYTPKVGVLYSDGRIESYFLDTAKDKYLIETEAEDVGGVVNLEKMMEEMESMGEACFDFEQAVLDYFRVHTINKTAQHILLRAMERKTKK